MIEQETVELIDNRIDLKTNIIVESPWFEEKVREIVIDHLKKVFEDCSS